MAVTLASVDYSSVLRAARTQAGLSQAELARLAGTSQPAVARYELGRASPTTKTLARLLDACRQRRTVSRGVAPSSPLWSTGGIDVEDAWFARQLARPGEDAKPAAAAIRDKWRARGVDVDRLTELMAVSAAERVKRLEDFRADVRALRAAAKTARRS